MGHRVTKVALGEGGVTAVTTVDHEGREATFAGEHFISSMPIKDLIAAISPPPPDSVVAAAQSLRYRDFLTVGLVINKPELFKDNWIYIHSPEREGRTHSELQELEFGHGAGSVANLARPRILRSGG